MTQPCSFSELKTREGPPLNAWGLFGEDNELGCLNLITDAAVKRGRDSVQHGIVINLNLPLSNFPEIWPKRGVVQHTIISGDAGAMFCDDEVVFNTQCSSQWDGFRHVPYQNYPNKGECCYYAGVTHEQAKDVNFTKYGTGNFAKHPITTRAILLDIPRWLAKKGLPPLKPLTVDTPITLEMLKGCAADQGVKFAPGDVLVVRSGWTEAFIALEGEARKKYDPIENAGGVFASEEVMQWHWENGFAAVAGDTFAYEVWPPTFKVPSIHEVFLSGWGCPLGELWDLRELAETCAKLNKYDFLLTTMALNIDAGIGTPSNGQAIL